MRIPKLLIASIADMFSAQGNPPNLSGYTFQAAPSALKSPTLLVAAFGKVSQDEFCIRFESDCVRCQLCHLNSNSILSNLERLRYNSCAMSQDLKKLRMRLRLSQSELARLASVSRIRICLHELGDQPMRDADLKRVMRAFRKEATRMRQTLRVIDQLGERLAG